EKTKNERDITNERLEKRNHLEKVQQHSQSLERLWKELKKLNRMRSDYQAFTKEFRDVKASQAQAKKAYEDALEEIRSHHAYTLSLSLSQGSACPVCGSPNHPQPAQKPAHILDESELERLKAAYQTEDQAFQRVQEKAVQVKSEGETQRQLTEALYEDLRNLVKVMEETAIKEAYTQVNEEISTLKNRISALDQEAEIIQTSVNKMQAIESKLESLLQESEKAKQVYYEKQQEQTRLETKEQSFRENYSFSTTDSDELNNLVKKAENEFVKEAEYWEQIQNQYSKVRDEYHSSKVTEEEAEKYKKHVESAARQQKEKFKQTFDQFKFSSEKAYRDALLPDQVINDKQLEIDQYNQKKAIVTERMAYLQEKLKDKERPDLVGLQSKWEEFKLLLKEQQQKVNELHLSVKQNKEVYASLVHLVQEQGELAKQYYDIAELAQLAKGDNHLRLSLERYVLAAFLDEILVQANIRLDQMTDHRYQLVRSDEVAKRGAQSGLDLEVLDHHTGQQRSVRTLSGGEGFKASLSLALGMADVVQSHAGGVQLDTLFIDEGFGTLDEISLEQAIECLRGLQDGNRMLGIISHVPQLKEEIPAKLQIETGQDGSRVKFVFQ
ncbi:SbcC/MukB-like Walker B domain-containing protein, partial [Halobacillus sp. BBL2006]|uniref:SbcC/MukB-like Walker B domain-containing protein n=1 Tax=Halobacillus sp. BBL2006 TaxID=1543706 RepID=UPI00054356BC